MDRSEFVPFVVNQCRNGELVEADNALFYSERTIQVNPLPSPPCFAQLLGAGAKMKHSAITIDMIERMGSKGTTPSVFTRSILMNYLCQLKRSNLGFSVLCRRVKLGLEPTTVSFNTLINGLVGEGRIAKAMSLADESLARQIKVDKTTCRAMPRDCADLAILGKPYDC